MSTDPKLETYLTALDQALRPLPVSERADILTEIKSHVLSALERDPQQPIDTVLAALGEPETVANRYLMERGRAPVKPPISPIVRWLVIGFLGTVAMVLLFIGFVVAKLAPKLDLNSEHVSFSLTSSVYQGSYSLKKDEQRPISLRFKNAKMELRTSPSPKITWACKGVEGQQPEVKVTDKELLLDLSNSPALKCEIGIPENAHLQLDGINVKLSIVEPRFHVNAQVTNAKIGLQPDPARKYHYDLSAVNGIVDSFSSSDDPAALQMVFHLTNGKLSRDE